MFRYYYSQVLFPTKDIGDLQKWYETEEDSLGSEAKSIICKTLARKRMQVTCCFCASSWRESARRLLTFVSLATRLPYVPHVEVCLAKDTCFSRYRGS